MSSHDGPASPCKISKLPHINILRKLGSISVYAGTFKVQTKRTVSFSEGKNSLVVKASGEASLMRVVMLFRNERRRCESDAHGGGGSGGTPPENFEI